MNNNIFSADLSTLTLNNNCLVKTINNTKNVVSIPYVINFTTDNSYIMYPKRDSRLGDIRQETERSIPALMASCNSLPNCRGFNDDGWVKHTVKNKLDSGTGTMYIRNGKPALGTYTYTNTLNMLNANNENNLIFAYIFIPTTQYYKFRVTTTNSAYAENDIYNRPCRIYLNSFQTVILDSYIQNNETRFEVIKKGTYLICIDVPQTDAANPTRVIPVSFEYMNQNIGTTHPDRALTTSWTTLNNLLITNCDTLLTNTNAWTLVDLFLNSANEYCKKDNNIISTACTDYYTNVPKYITKSLNEKNLLSNKSIYPDPINGEYGNWSISDTDWSKDMKNLSTEYGSCGKQATRTRSRTYYPPRYGGNENKQSPDTSDTQQKDVNCHTDTDVNTEWANRSCNNTIPSAIREAQFNSDITTLKTELDKYNKATLISGLSADNSKLNTCYTDWNGKSVSSFTLVGGDETNVSSKQVMYPNVCYMNNYKWTRSDTTNVLTMQTDGNLVLSKSDGTVLWSTNTGGNTNARLCVLRTGKLVIYTSDGTELWSYDSNNTIFSITDGMWYELSNINTIIAMKNSTTVVYGNISNRLCSNLFYSNGYTISSPNNKFQLQIKPNGAFYLYPSTNTNNVLWDSLTGNSASARIVLQPDGNLVIVPSNATNTLWKSDTNGNNGAYCELTDNGLILIRSKSNASIIKCLNPYDTDATIKRYFDIKGSDITLIGGDEKCINKQNYIFPYIRYSNGYTWENTKFKLSIQSDGNFVLYGKNNNSAVWAWNNVYDNGDYIIINSLGTIRLMSSTGKTARKEIPNDAVCFIELTDNGFLLIKKCSDSSFIFSCMNQIDSEGTAKLYYNGKGEDLIVSGSENMCIALNKKHIIFPYIRYTNGFEWFTTSTRLAIQTDGNFVLYANDSVTWASNTKTPENTNNTYVKITSKGSVVVFKTSNNEVLNTVSPELSQTEYPFVSIIRYSKGSFLSIKTSESGSIKFLQPNNYYISGSQNWKYVDTWERLTSDCKNNWIYLNNSGEEIGWINSRATRMSNNGQLTESLPWAATNNDTSSADKTAVVSNETINGISNIIHIVLINYLAERIYIQPSLFKEIVNKAKKLNDDTSDLGCTGDEYEAVNAYTINDYFSKLETSSDIVNPGFRPSFRFNRDYGGWHDNDTKHNDCTRFHNLYADNRYVTEKKSLADDGFKSMSGSKNDHINWLRNNRGASRYDTYWRVYYRTVDDFINFVNKKSFFTNKKIIPYKKSNFLSKINNALPYNTQGKIVENFINPICNLTNILKDPACSGSEYDTYKQYLTTMDTYCNKNPLNPVCSSYITKEIVSIENPTDIIKINEENKIKILNIQENACTDKLNYLDPRCVTINSKKPKIIQKQIQELDKESLLYKQLAANYGEEINYQTCIIGTNMLDKDKDMCKQLELNSVKYGSQLKSKRLEVCKQDSNIFHKECIELNKREQFPVITEYCAKDTNLLQKECLDFNKEYKLSEIKQQCKDNKTNNCKQLCKEYNEDFKDICFWENNQIYFILVFIALIIIGGVIGYFKFKGRKVINTQTQQTQPNTVYTQPGMLLNTTVPSTSPEQYQVAATPMQYQVVTLPQQDQAVEQIPTVVQPMNNT